MFIELLSSSPLVVFLLVGGVLTFEVIVECIVDWTEEVCVVTGLAIFFGFQTLFAIVKYSLGRKIIAKVIVIPHNTTKDRRMYFRLKYSS